MFYKYKKKKTPKVLDKPTSVPTPFFLITINNSQHTLQISLPTNKPYIKNKENPATHIPKLILRKKPVEATARKQRMSYYNQQQPPVGVPPPQGWFVCLLFGFLIWI